MNTKLKMVHCILVDKLDHRDKIQWYVYYYNQFRYSAAFVIVC